MSAEFSLGDYHITKERHGMKRKVLYIMIETAQNLEVGNNLGLLYQIYRFWVGKKNLT